MRDNYRGVSDSKAYNMLLQRLRTFFLEKGFREVHTQDRLSILAACEDPSTVATFDYAGETWPLPQTGQMWLEYELLTEPDIPGIFCVSTSYRNEQRPVPGRHKLLFPMLEFESHGSIDDLRELESELLMYLGFGPRTAFAYHTYDELRERYGVPELSHKEENRMAKDISYAVFCEKFPVRTSPFWNMHKEGEYARKIDVILHGNETIGSAERSSNVEEMRRQFHEISDGKYAGKLYELFGRDRVEKELEDFLSLNFFPRFGGGIGMTRLIDAWKKHGAPAFT